MHQVDGEAPDQLVAACCGDLERAVRHEDNSEVGVKSDLAKPVRAALSGQFFPQHARTEAIHRKYKN